MPNTKQVTFVLADGFAVADISIDDNDTVNSIWVTGIDVPANSTEWGALLTNMVGAILVAMPAMRFQPQYGVHKFQAPHLPSTIHFAPQAGPTVNLAAPSLGSLHITNTLEECHTRMAVRKRGDWAIDSVIVADFDNFGGLLRLDTDQ